MADPTRRRPPPAVQAALILAALVAVFLQRPILHGGWYLPGDLTQIAGTETVNPTGAYDFQNQVESDPATQMDPWLRYDRQELHAGRLPTWNPYNGLGVPQLANYQSAVFSPYSVPFYVLPLRAAYLVAAFLKLWTLAFFSYLFLRRLRLRQAAALFGATVYGFAGYQLLWLNWAHTGASVCLPAGAWATLVALQADTPRRRRGGLALLAGAVAWAVLAGHPETLFWSALSLVVVILVAVLIERRGARARLVAAVQLAAAGALGVAIGAVQLVPFLEYLHISSTYADRSSAGSPGGIDILSWPLLAFPDVLGSPALAYRDAGNVFVNYQEANGDYVGLTGIGLALLAIVLCIRARRHRGWMGVALGLAVAEFLLLHVHAIYTQAAKTPGLKLATVARSQEMWIFGIAVLAALAVHELLESAATPVPGIALRVRRVAPVVIGAGALVTVALLGVHAVLDLQRHVPDNVVDTAVARSIRRTHVEWVLGCCLVALLAVVVLRAAPRRLPRWGTGGLAGLLVLAQFGVTGAMLRNYNPSLPSSLVYPLTPGYAAALAVTGNDTTLKDDSTFALPDSNLWWRTPQLTSYDAVGVSWYDDLYKAVFQQRSDYFFDEGSPVCLESLRLFGVRYLMSKSSLPLHPGTVANGSAHKVGPDVRGFTRVEKSGGVSVLTVPGSTGRFTVVHDTTVAPDQSAALATVSSCGFAANDSAVLLASGPGHVADGRAPLTGAAVATAGQPVRVLTDQPEHQRLQVAAGPGGELVMRQTWFPGWTATVDGHAEPIDRVDVAMRGVALSPGAHVVDLVYRPSSVREGAVLTGVGLVLTAALALTPSTLRRRRRSQPDAAVEADHDQR